MPLNEFNIDKEFISKCRKLGVEIVDAQLYTNSGVKYEFASSEDLKAICNELMNLVWQDPDGFKIGIKNTEDTHIIFIYYADDF